MQATAGGQAREYIYGMDGGQTILDGNYNLLRAEVYLGGRYVGTQQPAGGFVWAYSDPLGTVRRRSNGETDTGWPFGAFANTQNGVSPIHFTGKPLDTETGLDYFGARYYNSTLGRFMSPDWSDAPEPVPYADLSNPQSLNLYSYVLNNPVTATDADGHQTQRIHCKEDGCTGSASVDVTASGDPLAELSARIADFLADVAGTRASGGPYYARNPSQYMGKKCGTGQCVDFVKLDTGVPRVTSQWRAGDEVGPGTPPGTAIATFGSSGRYQNIPGKSHAAELVWISRDGKNAVIRDQWLHQAVHTRPISDKGGQGPPVDDLSRYRVIMGSGH